MIFGFGKKNRAGSFKDRVTEFWDWYVKVADRFYETIERGDCASLVQEVSGVTDRTLPGFAWVFGPGENGGHSFTVSGEGQLPKQLLADYWCSRAPQIPRWTFYGSRQPTPPERLADLAIQVSDEESVDAAKVLLHTRLDEESQTIDIKAWHPAFEPLTKEQRYYVLFLLLDEALGEFGTQTWLGEISIEPVQMSKETRSLDSLGKFIEHVQQYYKWEKLPPIHAYSCYQMPEQSKTPRGDTVVGSTRIPNVILDFLGNGGRLDEDPLAGTGAEFVYLAIDGDVFPEGQQAEVRGNIEDCLAEALEREFSGQTLGGAFGLKYSYIDLLLFDGDNSRQIIETALGDLQLRTRSRLKSLV